MYTTIFTHIYYGETNHTSTHSLSHTGVSAHRTVLPPEQVNLMSTFRMGWFCFILYFLAKENYSFLFLLCLCLPCPAMKHTHSLTDDGMVKNFVFVRVDVYEFAILLNDFILCQIDEERKSGKFKKIIWLSGK